MNREIIAECIRLATHAPSGSNAQAWDWILVDEPQVKRAIADLNRPAADAYVEREDVRPGLRAGVRDLADTLADVPLIVVPCYRRDPSASREHHAMAAFFGSIYPAVQSFLLCVQAVGLGATPTTMALRRLEELRELLALPGDVWPCMVVPVGLPTSPKFTAAARRPISEIVHCNRYGSSKS